MQSIFILSLPAKKYVSIFLLVFLMALLGGSIISSRSAYAAETFTVTTTGDTADANIGDGFCDDGTGECALRAAIEESNGYAGVDSIHFNIGPLDGSVKTIQPTSMLPQITDQVTIDGFTQDDAAPNTAISPNPINAVVRIEVDGSLAGGTHVTDGRVGFRFVDGSDGSTIRGLSIGEWVGAGVFAFPGADGIQIKGNYIGVDATGTVARGNIGSGISMTGTSGVVGGPINGVIGGIDPGDRNIISNNDCECGAQYGSQGIAVVYGGNDWTIQGNYIGLAADGVTPMGNQLGGITVDYVDGLVIGGTATGAANVFSGNHDGGIQPDACTDVIIQGNFIGTDYTGTVNVGNDFKGISFAIGTSNSLVGGTTPGAGNTIAFNGTGGGVYVFEGDDIAILGNSIHDNQDLGIDLGADLLTPNDVNDIDAGPNGFLNFPDNLQMEEVSGDTVVDFSLDVPAGDYRIEFFSNTTLDASGHGEGESFLGFADIESAGTGPENFTATLTGLTGLVNVVATATEVDLTTISGYGSTSEYSAPMEEPAADTRLSKSLLNPEDVAVGNELIYRFVLTNDGPANLDLSLLDGSIPGVSSLILELMPPDLTYVSQSNQDVTCNSYGPGSGAGLGPGLSNHTDHEVVNCGYDGPLSELSAGDSLTVDMTLLVTPLSDLTFTNYAYSTPVQNDPDIDVVVAAFGGGVDVIDALGGLNENFPAAQFPLPINPPVTVPAPDSGVIGTLVTTGSDPFALAIFSISLAILGWCLVRKVPRQLLKTKK